MTCRSRSKVVCECLKVTEGKVVEAIRSGRACTLRQIAACTEAGSGCNACGLPVSRVAGSSSLRPAFSASATLWL